MSKTIPEAVAFVRQLASVPIPAGLATFVLPAHTALAAVRDALAEGSPILLGAQNAHWEADGAATGEVSMRMIADAGARLVELGHSERRETFCETDERVGWKVRAAVDAGLIPLVCVGEPLDVRDAGGATEFVSRQVRAALSGLGPAEVACVMIAYEPIWAIGEHGRSATLEEIVPVVTAITDVAAGCSDTRRVRAVLYGGSVDQGNVQELVTAEGVDGVFVGRAAWEPLGMQQLIELVGQTLVSDSDGAA